LIVEVIVTTILFIPELLLSLLPIIELEIPNNVLVGISEVLGAVAYIFPITALLPILIINLAMDMFRIIVALVVRIKSFIPTMGA
jgi:hypothetical protein